MNIDNRRSSSTYLLKANMDKFYKIHNMHKVVSCLMRNYISSNSVIKLIVFIVQFPSLDILNMLRKIYIRDNERKNTQLHKTN